MSKREVLGGPVPRERGLMKVKSCSFWSNFFSFSGTRASSGPTGNRPLLSKTGPKGGFWYHFRESGNDAPPPLS